MSIVERELALLRHPRLAVLATSALPAWLIDGSQILWANAVGAAMFGADDATACTQRRFELRDGAAAEIIRLAATLPVGEEPRLERLRGFGAGRDGALACACARLSFDDGNAVLVAATEPAGPDLTLAERVRRLFVGTAEAAAVFAPDGKPVYANTAAQARLRGLTQLSALGIETFAATALETGRAAGTAQLGRASFDVAAIRLGDEDTRLILVTMPGQPACAAPSAPQAPPAAPTKAVMAGSVELPITPAQAAVAAAPPEPTPERRHPLRFVWQIDADGCFSVGSDEFIELVGPRCVALFGRPWHEIAAALELDPAGAMARAVASRETWSGIVVSWPVDDTGERLTAEMAGLPVFDRDRNFRGYRGFGVCRDIDRVNRLARRRRATGVVPAAAPPPAAASPAPTEAVRQPAAPPPERTVPGATPAAANVVPFRPSPAAEPKAAPAETKSPVLSPLERRAFRELAQELTARLRAPDQTPSADTSGAEALPAEATVAALGAQAAAEPALIDRIPVGVLVYRHDSLLYANRHFLDWSGYPNLGAIAAAGGLNRLFGEPGSEALVEPGAVPSAPVRSLSIVTADGDKLPVEGRMFTVPWNGGSALALILANGQPAAAETRNRELTALLDAAADGVITLDGAGRIVGANARAATLFGTSEFAGRSFGELLAPPSEAAARDCFERIVRGAGTLNNILDVTGRAAADRPPVQLAMTLTRLGPDRVGAVFRDVTGRKQSEDELRAAKRETLRAAAAKAEFLAKVSHEIRTPLNAMTGFADVIMAERFGPISNERYREYIKDIHTAGTQLVAMLNDLLDLSRVEAGQIELSFANINLNELTQQCVAIMQPQANRARIIIRTSLTPGLPLIVADERALRQIVLNLIANSIRTTGPGGQVIVSTVFTDSREAVLRVRDTGAGMSEKDIAAALEPFRDIATSGSWGSGGAGFGLPLTKALAEANRANFSIKSAPNAGTLVEVAFPPSRVVAA